MSKKKIIIEILLGNKVLLEKIDNLIEGITIMTDDGYVDTDFLMELLQATSSYISTSRTITEKLYRLMGAEVDNVREEKNSQITTGETWSAMEVLKNCEYRDNIIKLPNVKLAKKSYEEVKKRIAEAGGSWAGGSIQGFTFPFDATRVFDFLKKGERYNIKQIFQFFETPDSIADWLVGLAGSIKPYDIVLEPSAGRGALIRAIHRSCKDVIVDCYELMPENKDYLKTISNVVIKGDDFSTAEDGQYSKIIANPPFAKNQDVDHVRRMYDLLQPNGVIAAITSKHWQLGSEKKCEDFRLWIQSLNAKVFEIPAGKFKESGTNIATVAIVIRK